jgi:hypothetical protein
MPAPKWEIAIEGFSHKAVGFGQIFLRALKTLRIFNTWLRDDCDSVKQPCLQLSGISLYAESPFSPGSPQ